MLNSTGSGGYAEIGDTSKTKEVSGSRQGNGSPNLNNSTRFHNGKPGYLSLSEAATLEDRASSPSTRAATVRVLPSMLQLDLLGMRMYCGDLVTAANWLLLHIKPTSQTPTLVAHINAYNFFILSRSPGLLRALSKQGLLLFDGLGLKLAGTLHGLGWLPDINGTDLFPLVMSGLAAKRTPVYFLGSTSTNVSRVADFVAKQWPTVPIAGIRSGYFSREEEASVVDRINASGAELLIVARGCPLQEKFALEHLKDLKVNAIWAVGGLFDFVSGAKPRAPRWVRAARLEWFYRFKIEPKRMWRRVSIIYPWFMYRALISSLARSRERRAVNPS
jgi:N-acetylglucosaminyldiphosphoundecaprenol N-acetyl-beta-D-mannosaminyltransferase